MKQPYKNFEEAFRILRKKAKIGSVTVETVLQVTSGKGKILLLIFLSLWVAQIPGISLFLGLAIGYLGLRIAIDRTFMWIPKFLLRKKIPSSLLIKAIKQILRILKFMKKWSRPRYTYLTQTSTTRILNGFMLCFTGISLAICPPVPFCGILASLAIFLIGIGLLNDDGVYIIIGYICVLLYFATTIFLLKFCSLDQIIHGIQNITTYVSEKLIKY